MKFLQELSLRTSNTSIIDVLEDASTYRLTDTQKSVLLGIYAAATPEMAYEAMVGSENVVQAGMQLHKIGLINIDADGNRAGVTDVGQQSLSNHNLIDDTGQLTDEGQQTLDAQNQVKSEFENATESVKYSVLKNLI